MIRCAFYEKEITPPLGSEIPGYYAKRVSTGVMDRLYVKAVVFDDGSAQTALIAVDAVELPAKIYNAISTRIQEAVGIAPAHIAVCATHTHLGVPAGEPIGSAEDTEFMSLLCKLAADCVILAQQKLQPCSLCFGTGQADGISFNRDYVMSDGSVCTNPGKSTGTIVRPYAENDPELPLLVAKDENGKPLGALLSFACHQDCIGGTKFSGDYSSELSRQLKTQFGEDFVSIYVAGASGDINHINPIAGSASNYQMMGRKLAAEATRIIEQDHTPVAGSRVQCRKEDVVCAYRHATPDEIAKAEYIVAAKQADPHTMLGSLMSELLLDYEKKMDKQGLKSGALPIQVMSVGELFIFALPGELYHQFGEKIKQNCPSRKCLIATLSNGAFGYIPVPELFGTCAYPVQLCEGSFWEPSAGNAITDRAIALAAELRG